MMTELSELLIKEKRGGLSQIQLVNMENIRKSLTSLDDSVIKSEERFEAALDQLKKGNC